MKKALQLAPCLTVLFPFLLLLGGAAADVAISVIAVLFLVRSYLEKDWAWTKETWVRCLFLLWLYMIARSLFADEPQEALRRSLPFARYFTFAAALAYWTLRDKDTLKYFLQALTLLVAFVACDGLVQWFAGRDILLHPILSYDQHTRLTGPFRGQILGAMLAWLSFPVCLQFIRTEGGKLRASCGIVLAPLTLAVIALSGERMALLLALAGWLAALLLLPVRRTYIAVIFAAGMVLVGAVIFASPQLFSRQVFSTIDTLRNWRTSPYGELLNSDMKIAQVNPVFGIGANHFRIVCSRLYSSLACNLHPHNIYMEWLIEQGIIGFTLFIAFIAAIAAKCRKQWQHIRNNPIIIGFLIAAIMRLWPLESSTGMFSRWGAPPFWLVIGALLMFITTAEA